MDSRYQFYLDNLHYDTPEGWADWVGRIERFTDIPFIASREEGKFTFYGAAFAYILQKRKAGYCTSIAVTVKESPCHGSDYATTFRGFIYLSECSFNLTKCSVECELVEDSYYAWIESNKQIECSIGAGKSKNGVDIAVPDLWDIQMFNPCDGLDSALPKPKAYRAHDVMSYIVAFISDGRMGFQSSALDIGGEFEGLFLTKGLMMTDPSNPDTGIIFKFEAAIRNLCTACGLAFKIDKSAAGFPVLVLEKFDDIFVDQELLSFSNVYEILQQIDQSRNYAAVELGTDNILESLGCGALGGSEPAFPDQINLLGCKREQFAVTGTCNINSVLDLTISWIISSNIVENIYFNGDDGYDEDVIVLDCTTLNATNLTASAIKHDVFGNGAAPYYYNANYFNKQIAERNFRGIPATLVKYLNYPDTGFKASHTGTEIITFPGTIVNTVETQWLIYPFGDDYNPDNYDLNNDWGNGTLQGLLVPQVNSCYTAPAQNVYKFRFTTNVQFINPSFAGMMIRCTFRRFDSSNVLIGEYPKELILLNSQLPQTVVIESPLIFMEAGDKLYLQLNHAGSYRPAHPTTFELAATGTQGGEFQIITEGEYIADRFQVSLPMTMAQYNIIRKNPTYRLSFDDGRNRVTGWIESLKHSRGKGMADVTLIASTSSGAIRIATS